jgi:hypothetical protein
MAQTFNFWQVERSRNPNCKLASLGSSTDTILDFGFAFAQRCASNFWIGEASRSKGFSLRTAASSV